MEELKQISDICYNDLPDEDDDYIYLMYSGYNDLKTKDIVLDIHLLFKNIIQVIKPANSNTFFSRFENDKDKKMKYIMNTIDDKLIFFYMIMYIKNNSTIYKTLAIIFNKVFTELKIKQQKSLINV